VPIPVGSSGVPVPPTPSNAPPVIGNAEAVWIDPTGVEWPLTDRRYGYWMTDGATGLGAPKRLLVTDENPLGGSTVRTVIPKSRIINLPLYVYGLTHNDFLANWRGLIDAFDMTCDPGVGPGIFRITRPGGTARQVRAYYQDGFDGTNGRGQIWDAAAISLLVESPFWESPTPLSIERKHTSDTSTFFSPFIHVSSGRTLGSTNLTNPGEIEAWPVWTIAGPATSVTATRHNPDGTDSAFTLTGAVDLGETVTVITDPTDQPQIIGPDGLTSWIDHLDWPGAELWSVPRGTTPVDFTVGGSGDGTRITLAFTPRWRAA